VTRLKRVKREVRKVKTFHNNAYLIILFFVVSVFIVSGCTKKVSKLEMAGQTVIQDEILEEEETAVEEEFTPEERILSEELEEHIEEEAVEDRKVESEAISDLTKEVGGLFPVYFDYDRYVLRADTRETLKRNAEWLRNKLVVRISIQGHADERGSNEYNLALGDRRAKTVKMYLADLGVTADLSTVTFGEERPVCLESFEECWSKNRRAEFVVLSD
jgi:peptidoglycan-associated lipoprotein